MKTKGLSTSRSCACVGLSRASYHRSPRDWRVADQKVIDALNDVLAKAPRSGFWKCFHRIRPYHRFNHKRVYRVYCLMGLNLPRRVKRTLPKRTPKPLTVVDQPNRQWALDFTARRDANDTLYCGRAFRTLNIIDEGTRECLSIDADTSLPSSRVILALERLAEQRGLPDQIRCDNGTELTSTSFVEWCKVHNIELAYIRPGKPQQNGFAERFNGSCRREFLDAYLFENLTQVRYMAWTYQQDVNYHRPHESLGNIPPSIYRQQLETSSSTLSQ